MKKSTNVIQSLIDKDFKYIFHVDYDSKQHCHEVDCESLHGGYCRCSTIENAHIENISIQTIVDSITNKNTSMLDKYGIDRILTKMNLTDSDYWDINICRGYYGQEIDNVKLNNAEKVQNNIDQFLALDTCQKKIEFLLLFEYGYLIDKVKNLTWIELTINKNGIYLLDNVMKKVDRDTVEKYKEYPYYKCIVIVDGEKFGEKYRLIDGYHRFVASNDKEIIVLCGMQLF
jgi:hypothetical protein